MSSNFTLSGTENLTRIFGDFPEEGYRKPMIRAFRKAAVPVRKAMISNLPSELKGLSKVFAIRTYKGSEPEVGIGVFRGEKTFVNSRGIGWNPWQIIYWFNYGTLANRLAGHSFSRPRGKKTATWKGGIKPTQFVEQGVEQGLPSAQRIFDQEFDKEMTKFFTDRADR